MSRSYTSGMRLLSLALCLLCLVSLASPVTAVSISSQELPADSDYTLTTAVHYYGSYGSTVIGQMENGTTVTVLGTRGSFYKVDCYDMTGYIAISQISQRENGEYYVNCQTGSYETLVMEYETMADALRLRHAILTLADQQVGDPYVYGGTRPGGFDCSGLTYFLYGQNGYALNRRASTQLQDGIVVPKEGMLVGDLVFFHESWDPCEASHVGIYAGNNQIIHSGSKGVGYADLDVDWFAENFLCARRVINTSAAQIADVTAPGAEGDACVLISASGRTAH